MRRISLILLLVSFCLSLDAFAVEVLNHCQALFGSQRHFDNTLRIGGPIDEAVSAEFLAAEIYDGSVKFPENALVSYTAVYHDGDSKLIKFAVGSIAKQNKSMRDLLKRLKAQSLYQNYLLEREFGAWIVEFTDGTSKVISFTLNLINHNGEDAFNKAFLNSGVSARRREIRRVIDIHTHPNPENPRLTGEGLIQIPPSGGDMNNIEGLKRQLGFWNPEGVEVSGIVIPNCATCVDTFFYYGFDNLNGTTDAN